MKTSVYINKENEERLKELLKVNPKVSTSGIINEALEDYFNHYNFDTSEFILRLHKEVVRLLVQLKRNFSAKVVNELIMVLIVREFGNQSGRKKFPDRLYMPLKYINKLICQLSKKADLLNVSKIE